MVSGMHRLCGGRGGRFAAGPGRRTGALDRVRAGGRALVAARPASFRPALVALVLLAFGAGPAPAPAQPPPEKARIEFLIASVEKDRGLTFIRNGAEHGAQEAAAHLRLKWQRAGERVRTAEEFIRLCASGSSLSGEPYLIRFPDGRTVEAEAYFRERLKAFRPPGPP